MTVKENIPPMAKKFYLLYEYEAPEGTTDSVTGFLKRECNSYIAYSEEVGYLAKTSYVHPKINE